MIDLPSELQQLEARMANTPLFTIVMRATNQFQSP
jgi:hypothetical protein